MFNIYELQVHNPFQYSFIDERLVLSFQNNSLTIVVNHVHNEDPKNGSTSGIQFRRIP